MVVGPKPGNLEFRSGQRQRRIPKRNDISKVLSSYLFGPLTVFKG